MFLREDRVGEGGQYMTAVLAGFLLVLLHLKEEGLELFLKLAGYILIAGGLTGFLKESVIFARARKGAVVLAVCAGILWLGSLYELSLSGPTATVFGWLVTDGDMYIRYMTVAGIQDMEQAGNEEFYSFSALTGSAEKNQSVPCTVLRHSPFTVILLSTGNFWPELR